MASYFLMIPDELKLKIIESMFPLLAERHLPTSCAMFDYDTQVIFLNVKALRNVAASCKSLRHLCMPVLMRVVQFDFNEEQVAVREMGGRRLPRGFCPVTKFLSLDGPKAVKERLDPIMFIEDDFDEESDDELPEDERTKPLIFDLSSITSLDHSIATAFIVFHPITFLNISNCSLSLPFLFSLKNLTCLETLSIRVPRLGGELIPNIEMLQTMCRLPNVVNLNIVVIGFEEVAPVSNVVKLFEESVRMLSITGDDYTGKRDFLRPILLSKAHATKLCNLKHLNIDFIDYRASTLRKIMQESPDLETLTVDCRGIAGFLPLFYLIDLIKIFTEELFDDDPMLEYEMFGVLGAPNIVPYNEKAHLWLARVSRFTCTFKTIETENGPMDVLDTAEIFIALTDDNSDQIVKHLRFTDALEVFRESAFTFRYLRTLIFATANEEPAMLPESFDQLKDITAVICENYLAAANDVTIRWGEVAPVHWKAGQIEMLPMDAVWKFSTGP